MRFVELRFLGWEARDEERFSAKALLLGGLGGSECGALCSTALPGLGDDGEFKHGAALMLEV